MDEAKYSHEVKMKDLGTFVQVNMAITKVRFLGNGIKFDLLFTDVGIVIKNVKYNYDTRVISYPKNGYVDNKSFNEVLSQKIEHFFPQESKQINISIENKS